MQEITKAQFLTLAPVRVSSAAGPCLTQYRMLRRNQTTATVAYRNGGGISVTRVRLGAVHDAP